jgi:hypothetical protein
MNLTFADTYYYLALLNPRDAGHARAITASAGRSSKLVTTRWVLAEVGDALATPQRLLLSREIGVGDASHNCLFVQGPPSPR